MRLRFLLAVLAAALAGCASARLPAPTGPTPTATGDLGGPLRQAWRYDAEAGFGETPGVIVGNLLYVGTRSGEVRAIRLETGKKVAIAKLFDSIETAPLPVGDNRLFVVPKSRQRPVLLQLGGETVWTARERIPVSAQPSLEERFIRVTGRDWTGLLLNRETGDVIEQRTFERRPVRNLGLLAYHDPHGGQVVVFSLADSTVRGTSPEMTPFGVALGATDGALRMIEGDTLRWMRDLGDPITAAPTFYNGRLYVGTLGRNLFVLDAATGAILQETRVGGRIQSRPLVYPGGVIVFAEPSHVYHFVPATDETPAAR